MQSGLRLAANYSPCIYCLTRAQARTSIPSLARIRIQKRFSSSPASERAQVEDGVQYLYELSRRHGEELTQTDDRVSKIPRRPSKLDNRFLDAKLDMVAQAIKKDPIILNLDIAPEHLRSSFIDYRNHLLSIIEGRCSPEDLPSWLEPIASSLKRLGAGKLYLSKLQEGYLNHAIMSTFSEENLRLQHSIAQMSYPQEWYPATRSVPRTFHLHLGPTNSGKTYQALKRLREAPSGCYGGPLRLLAQEVYMRLNAAGLPCNLITGDDRRVGDEAHPNTCHTSCTVEMLPLNTAVDVAVIDEIQMLGSPERGYAWTQALLGVQAKEVHLCGETRAQPLVEQLVALCGDELVIHHYERLSPLEMMPQSLNGRVDRLKKGDCVVCFQVKTIHAIRQQIEQTLGVKCAMIYGSLPPETRAQQAALFNDPDNDYDILVASDAVGMGLNLNINRMIFQSSTKYSRMFDKRKDLEVHEVKQIAGRAGRFSTADSDIRRSKAEPAQYPTNDSLAFETQDLDTAAPVAAMASSFKQVGYVNSLEAEDYNIIRSGFEGEAAPLTAAGIFPPSYLIDRFSKLFPLGTPFAFLLRRLHECAKLSSRFFLCYKEDGMKISDAIEAVRGLSIYEKAIFNTAPSSIRSPEDALLLQEFAECVATGQTASIFDVKYLNLEALDPSKKPSHNFLEKIETLHKGIVLYLWLSYRFPTVFVELDKAIHIRHLCEQRIEDTLAALSFDISKIKKARETFEANKERIRALGEKEEIVLDGPDGDPDQQRPLEALLEMFQAPQTTPEKKLDRPHRPFAKSDRLRQLRYHPVREREPDVDKKNLPKPKTKPKHKPNSNDKAKTKRS